MQVIYIQNYLFYTSSYHFSDWFVGIWAILNLWNALKHDDVIQDLVLSKQ